MNNHKMFDCMHRELVCPLSGCSIGVKAYEYSSDPKFLKENHDCPGVFVCEEHEAYLVGEDEWGKHLALPHESEGRPKRKRTSLIFWWENEPGWKEEKKKK
jgi:hypothetical protein